MYTVKALTGLFIVTILSGNIATSQTISQFTWESGVTTPDVGPSPTSISGSAVNDPGGVSSTMGLNPGLPEENIDMVLPGGSYDVEGVDISVDHQWEEEKGYFFKRGNSLKFGFVSDKLRIQYRIDDGMGGFVQITQTNIYTLPHDDTYRNYRFTYDQNTGLATVYVDGVNVWDNSSSLTPGQAMYWSGAGDLIFGEDMDADENNVTILDNMLFKSIATMALPIKLVDFSAEIVLKEEVELLWATVSEINNDIFTVERSTNGYSFESIGTLKGAGNSSVRKEYSFVDNMPVEGAAYYRLKQTDFDGTSTYSKTLAVEFAKDEENQCTLKVYPNPCIGSCTVKLSDCALENGNVSVEVYDISGNAISSNVQSIDENESVSFHLNTSNNLSPGVYIVKAGSGSIRSSEKVIVK